MEKVRVRYAPSPTGYLHVGGVRAFLFNWLYALRHNGTLVLRVDDTDQKRSTKESETMVLSTLKTMGLLYQEGPDVGGNYGPYRQSERFPIYAEHIQKLIKEDKVYYCFCTPETIGAKREAALKLGKTPHYDGTCAKISREQALKKIQGGERAGLRFRAPQKDFILNDVVRGRIEFLAGTVGDFMITRSPGEGEHEIAAGIGMPVYNFCTVIDEHLMNITHVIRGEDHLSNTSRQLMLYDGFGWEPPVFAHTAMVVGADKLKLSKRNGDVSAHDYIDKGYLPQALINFLALLGWWPPSELKPSSGHPEILSIEEMAAHFRLEDLQKSPAVFDTDKLKWMNSYYIKHMPLNDLAEKAEPYFKEQNLRIPSHDFFIRVLEAIRGEAVLLADLPAASSLFFQRIEDIVLEDPTRALLNHPDSIPVTTALTDALNTLGSTAEFETIQKKVADQSGKKGKFLMQPLRAAITGKTSGPELKKVYEILGHRAVQERVHRTLELAQKG